MCRRRRRRGNATAEQLIIQTQLSTVITDGAILSVVTHVHNTDERRKDTGLHDKSIEVFFVL